MAYLKLIEKGVPRENLALLAVPLTPIEMIMPLIVSSLTNGPSPLKTYLNSYPFRYFNFFLLNEFHSLNKYILI